MGETCFRAFVAVDLEAQAIEWIRRVIRDKRAMFPTIKWVDPNRMHLTLHFFPVFPARRVPELQAELTDLAGLVKLFTLKLAGMGVFPSPKRAKVLWLGIDPVATGTLGIIAARLEDKLENLGFEREEKPFRAHVTLGRFRTPQVIDPGRMTVTGECPSEINRLVLYQSTLTPQGPIYRELAGARFGQADS